MPAFQLRSFAARRALFATPARSFQSGRVFFVGKESALNTEGRADEVERVKNEQIQKQKDGKGHWHEDIASDSESIVKADRGDIDASHETIEKLQQETAKLAEEKQKK